MKRSSLKWSLVVLVVALACGAAAWAGGTPQTSLSLPLAVSTPATPPCSLPGESARLLEAHLDLEPGSTEPQPTDNRYCNCDVDKDCDAICGPRGGICGIFMACPIPPYKHVGTCFCNQTPASPADPDASS